MAIYSVEKRQNKFIDRAQQLHKNRYDYSKVIYTGVHKKVEIICIIHGSFFQSPAVHSQGSGCTQCFLQNIRKDAVFIERSNILHKNIYDYSKVIYKNNCSKVSIGCKIHGIFKQQPAAHLSGQGCPTCRILKHISNQESNTKEFIKKANLIHNSLYSYDYVDYKRALKILLSHVLDMEILNNFQVII
jgi:hypothetical protein